MVLIDMSGRFSKGMRYLLEPVFIEKWCQLVQASVVEFVEHFNRFEDERLDFSGQFPGPVCVALHGHRARFQISSPVGFVRISARISVARRDTASATVAGSPIPSSARPAIVDPRDPGPCAKSTSN